MKIGIDLFDFFIVLMSFVVTIAILEMTFDSNSNEQIKQLKQSNMEIQQECEVYRNRNQELENMIEESGLVVDNCECR